MRVISKQRGLFWDREEVGGFLDHEEEGDTRVRDQARRNRDKLQRRNFL